MTHRKDEKLREAIRHAAAAFIERESNLTSLVTVTDVTIKNRGRLARVLLSIFPQEKEGEALAFVKRRRSDFKEFLKNAVRMRVLPAIDFAIDIGEKNLQKIDELLRKK